MATMNVILLEGVQGVGNLGDVVPVKAGFARNFLLPRNKAVIANDANKAKLEADRKALEKKNAEAKAAAEKLAAKFTELTLNLQRLASETGQLYGSVKARDIAAALDEKKLEVEAGQVMIGNPIREVGDHAVRVALHPEVIVDLTVTVERQSS